MILCSLRTPTIAPEPISHIGIYVGNGKMLHCGNPIGYADLSNSVLEITYVWVLRALNEQQEVSMNWREELRKEAEQLHKENGILPFSRYADTAG